MRAERRGTNSALSPPPLPAGRPAGKRRPAFGHLCKRPFADVLFICKIAPQTHGANKMPVKPQKAATAGRLSGYVRP